MAKVPSHVKLYLVGAPWCRACDPAFKLLTAAGWPVEYLDIDEADRFRIPPSLPQLVVENLNAGTFVIGPDVRAMKDTLKSLFGGEQ